MTTTLGSAGPVPETVGDPRPPRAGRAARAVSSYAELLRTIQGAGLMRRRRSWYWLRFAATVAALAGLGTVFVFLGNSWWQLVVAAALAALLTQLAFFGHDSGHRQVFGSQAWNEWASRLLSGMTGLSYGWWMSKHSRHHGAPNQETKDPDIAPGGLVAFTPAIVASRPTGVAGLLARNQGYVFFPLLLLEGLNLHVSGVRHLLAKQRSSVKLRWLDLTFIVVRLGAYIAALLIFLPPGKAAAFFGVQVGLFGFFMGAAFAPNHTGMPIVPASSRIDFLQRQVLMSRNVSGGFGVDFALGGLNFQIEHHLFPSMARPNLRAARVHVRDFCDRQGIPYTETTLFGSYRIIIDYLNNVGLRARDPFACPLLAQYRG